MKGKILLQYIFNKNKRKDYISFLKKIYRPTKKEWISKTLKVSLIIFLGFISLFALDFFLSGLLPVLQSFINKIHINATSLYLIILVFTMIITVITVLLQQGEKTGLTSMLGSNIQYSDITGSFTSKIGKSFTISTILLFCELLIAPIFLGGSV